MESPSFSYLRERAQQNLIEFLKVEVSLGTTFLGMVQKAESLPHRRKLLKDIRKAIATVRHHFSDQIEDAPTRAKISKGADQLEAKLSKLDPATHI